MKGLSLIKIDFKIFLFREALDNIEAGIKVNGIMLNNLSYADMVMLDISAEELTSEQNQ